MSHHHKTLSSSGLCPPLVMSSHHTICPWTKQQNITKVKKRKYKQTRLIKNQHLPSRVEMGKKVGKLKKGVCKKAWMAEECQQNWSNWLWYVHSLVLCVSSSKCVVLFLLYQLNTLKCWVPKSSKLHCRMCKCICFFFVLFFIF